MGWVGCHEQWSSKFSSLSPHTVLQVELEWLGMNLEVGLQAAAHVCWDQMKHFGVLMRTEEK